MKYLISLLLAAWVTPAIAANQPKRMICESDNIFISVTAKRGTSSPALAELVVKKDGRRVYKGVFKVTVNEGGAVTSYFYSGHKHSKGSLIVLGDESYGRGSFFINTKAGALARENSANCRISQ
jgi:hypothetical protein